MDPNRVRNSVQPLCGGYENQKSERCTALVTISNERRVNKSNTVKEVLRGLIAAGLVQSVNRSAKAMAKPKSYVEFSGS